MHDSSLPPQPIGPDPLAKQHDEPGGQKRSHGVAVRKTDIDHHQPQSSDRVETEGFGSKTMPHKDRQAGGVGRRQQVEEIEAGPKGQALVWLLLHGLPLAKGDPHPVLAAGKRLARLDHDRVTQKSIARTTGAQAIHKHTGLQDGFQFGAEIP